MATKATKGTAKEAVVEIKGQGCPGCEASDKSLLQMRPSRLCVPCINRQIELEMESDAPAASTNNNAAEPVVATEGEEPNMASTKNSGKQPKAAASKKTATKATKVATQPKQKKARVSANTVAVAVEPKAPKSKRGLKLVPTPPPTETVAAEPKAAKQPKVKTPKAAAAPKGKGAQALGPRDSWANRQAKVVPHALNLLKKQEQINWRDVRPLVPAEAMTDRSVKWCLRLASHAGVLKAVAPGTYRLPA